MSSNVVIAADIHNLLRQVEQGKGIGFSFHPEANRLLPAGVGPYYAPALQVSEQRSPSQARIDRDSLSTTSGATTLSAVFDVPNSQSMRSDSTAPPRRGPVPRHHQRGLVPDFTASWLPCEFRRLSGCGQRFLFQDIERWIEHTIDEHLRRILPDYSICWFCDDVKFRAPSTRTEDRNEFFRRRMHHIADHFRAGKTAVDVRWDFHFLDHAHEHGLISNDVFRWAKGQSEVPLPRDMTFDKQQVGSELRTKSEDWRREAGMMDPYRPRRIRCATKE
ncbi:hypothetical protein HIM_01589 [Hirsutella minnesotensis 3608]|nr:hypothetical protein HIM_01589 [Hirsutella minnesotensis 3608]